jgi:polyphosphate glucokinase
MENGTKGEHYASDSVRKTKNLDWELWGRRFNKYLGMIEALFWPDLIILGGGASKKFDKFKQTITVNTPVKPATLLNLAGIIGAALFAQSQNKKEAELILRTNL